jgi:uncharacterized protein YyaL (SSP411 family)
MQHIARPRLWIAALVTSLLVMASVPAPAGPPKTAKDKPKFTNRLAKEQSPYLLMHAHNPVDWYPWGPEAFEKAKKENKLIFLSVGYSSCYWCHVMERECFNHADVAKLLNQWFVCIKVDREERPDVDQIYMTALSVIRRGAGGGWPMSMFLTSDAKPIVGGTYWPREDRVVDGEKDPGFMTICKIVHDAYRDQAKEVLAQADRVAEATVAELESIVKGIVLVDLDRKLLDNAVEHLKENFDPVHGGFGNASSKFRGPKFPLPSRIDFLLQQYERTKTRELLDMVTRTLDNMARGGIYDHLGGGFHRYSTERTWTVPHFEKMLYDNAQLVEVYAKAYRITKKPAYRKIVEETLAFVEREMTSPEGAFYTSLDAETHHEEGRFYVWTDKELDAALPDKADAQLIRKVYGAAKPNFEGKYHILRLETPLAEIARAEKLTEKELESRLAPLRKKLFDVRSQRDRPFLNKIALTSWSGQMIAGYAEAGRSLDVPKYVKTAIRAAEFLLKNQRTKDGRLLRTYGAAPGQPAKAQGNAYLEDYAFLVDGLLNLHSATGDKRWLAEARNLTDAMIRHHGDAKRGGFFFTAHDHEKLFARHKDQYDGAQPCGNSIALRNLARLAKLTGDKRYRDEAEKGFKSFLVSLKSTPTGLTAMLMALEEFLTLKNLVESQEQTGLPNMAWLAYATVGCVKRSADAPPCADAPPFVSAKGPSITASFPFAYRARTPFELASSRSAASIAPALSSSSV